MERKILAWLAMAVSLVAWFPCACILGLGSVWFAGVSVMSAGAVERFLGPGSPPPEFWGAMVIPTGLIAFVALVLGLVFVIWGARTVVKGRPEERPSITE